MANDIQDMISFTVNESTSQTQFSPHTSTEVAYNSSLSNPHFSTTSLNINSTTNPYFSNGHTPFAQPFIGPIQEHGPFNMRTMQDTHCNEPVWHPYLPDQIHPDKFMQNYPVQIYSDEVMYNYPDQINHEVMYNCPDQTNPEEFVQNYPETSIDTSNEYKSLSFLCPVCDQFIPGTRIFLIKIRFFQHMKTHLQSECPLCYCILPMKELIRHVINCIPMYCVNGECPICHVVCKNVSKLRPHIREHIPPFHCPIRTCSQMVYYNEFKRHLSQHVEPMLAEKCRKIHKPKTKKIGFVSQNKKQQSTEHLQNNEQPLSTNHVHAEKTYVDDNIPFISPNQHRRYSNNLAMESAVTQDSQEKETVHCVQSQSETSSCEDANRGVGDWEKHTKGIGMKLMRNMGYVRGQGLGPRGEGILKPVEAVLLPKKINLDTAINLITASNIKQNPDKITSEPMPGNNNKSEESRLSKDMFRKRKELNRLLDSIKINEDYLKIIQDRIKVEVERLEKLKTLPLDTIEIVDNDIILISDPNPIIESSSTQLTDDPTDAIVISSEDEIYDV